MPRFVNPRLSVFCRQLTGPTLFVQVLITPAGSGFGLRHAADATFPAAELRPLRPLDLSGWADLTATGAFRPNKAAPNLRRGWHCSVEGEGGLGQALDDLYPGALAAWHAVRSGTAVTTSLRDFLSRQTGIYRITRELSDRQADDVVRAGCHSRFCLRQRCWNSPGLGSESAEGKSVVPCLEPCALLLEFARRTARVQRENPVPLEVWPADRESLEAALETALQHPPPGLREGDMRHPANPRRIQFLLHQLSEARADRKPAPEQTA